VVGSNAPEKHSRIIPGADLPGCRAPLRDLGHAIGEPGWVRIGRVSSPTQTPYYEQLLPSRGVLDARAWFRSDASSLSLNGEWRFRLSPRADGETGA